MHICVYFESEQNFLGIGVHAQNQRSLLIAALMYYLELVVSSERNSACTSFWREGTLWCSELKRLGVWLASGTYVESRLQ